MPSTLTRRLIRLPIRLLATLVASIAAIAAVWHGGLAVLNWVGVANPARGDTGTALGLGAVAIGSSVVPTWMTARYYFHSKERLRRSSERAAAPAENEHHDDRDDVAEADARDEPPVADTSGEPTVVNAPHR